MTNDAIVSIKYGSFVTDRRNITPLIEQVRKRGLPPLLGSSGSGGKPLFLTCSFY